MLSESFTNKNLEIEKIQARNAPFLSASRSRSDFEGLVVGLREPRDRTSRASKHRFYQAEIALFSPENGGLKGY